MKSKQPHLSYGSVADNDPAGKLSELSQGVTPKPPVEPTPEIELPNISEKKKRVRKPKAEKKPKEPKPPRVRKESKRKRGIQLPPILTKRKKTPLGSQTIEIAKLLRVWPGATHSTIKEYVQDVMGVHYTRLCVREAKELLKLNMPAAKEKSQEKAAVIRHAVIGQIIRSGLGGYNPRGLTAEIMKALRQFWTEETNHRMIKRVSSAVLTELAGIHHSQYPALLEQAERMVKVHNLVVKSAQRELL